MEIDHLKSATEDQMEMMIMMMEDTNHKLPVSDFYSSYNPITDLSSPPVEFPSGATATTSSTVNSIPHFSESPQIVASTSNSTPFLNLPSNTNIPFTSPEASSSQPHFLSNPPPPARSRGVSELFPASYSQKKNSMAAMREMIFRIAAMQPIHIDPESVKPPKRRNVKISKDPQSVAARHRRERISERIRILQRLVPGGTKMDTASMLDEAIHYVKFLKTQVQSLERAQANRPPPSSSGIGFPVAMTSGSYLPLPKTYRHQNVEHYGDA